MKIEFISNASVAVQLSGGKTLLVDPWWRGPAFYGSWFNFPPVTEEDMQRYEALVPDAIYISHAHPDHLHPETLKRFHCSTPILIPKLPHSHLRRAVAGLGFEDIRELAAGVSNECLGAEVISIGEFGLSGDGYTDNTGYVMDSSLFIRDADGTTCLHVIDNAIQLKDASELRERFGVVDVAFLPYAGASFYPHAFYRYTDAEKDVRREAVTQARLNLFCEIAEILEPKVCVPAAGSYVMGGRIAHFSSQLHQAVPARIEERFTAMGPKQTRLCLMATGDVLDAASAASQENPRAPFRRFTSKERAEYAQRELGSLELPQDLISVPPDFPLPWKRLLNKARANQLKFQRELDVFPAVDVRLTITATQTVSLGGPATLTYPFAFDAVDSASTPGTADRMLVEFRIDASILLVLLLGGAIWDNAEIGALVECAREPDLHDPTVHSLMSYFTL